MEKIVPEVFQWELYEYGLNYYPMSRVEVYKQEIRDTYMLSLPEATRNFINDQKKYKIRSYFLNNNYSFSSQWEFLGQKTDPFYRDKEKCLNLKCDCGRTLKHQYILKSVDSQKVLKLGITHFKDHLNISDELAKEIQKNIHKVDLAVNELLWLVKQDVGFPEDLWNRYLFAVYRNQLNPIMVKLNGKLAYRVEQFKENDMPIFIDDYKQLINEIHKVDKGKITINSRSKTSIKKFNKFKDEFRCRDYSLESMSYYTDHPGKEVLDEGYFDKLTNTLVKIDNFDTEKLNKINDDIQLFENKYTTIDLLHQMSMSLHLSNGTFDKTFYTLLPSPHEIGIKKALKKIHEEPIEVVEPEVIDLEKDKLGTIKIFDSILSLLDKSSETKEIVEDQKNFKKISHDLFSVLTINKNHHFSNETRKFLDANKLDINDFILELEGFLSEKKEELFITQETNEFLNELVNYLVDLNNFYLKFRETPSLFGNTMSQLYLDFVSLEEGSQNFFKKIMFLESKSNINKNIEKNFYDKLFLILLSSDLENEELLILQLFNLMSEYNIEDWEISYNLIHGMYLYSDTGNFGSSFERLEQSMFNELEYRFSYKCFYLED